MVGQGPLWWGLAPFWWGQVALVMGVRRPSWWWGPITILLQNFVFGALFGLKEVLETHLTPFLDQISALEQNNFFSGTDPLRTGIFAFDGM